MTKKVLIIDDNEDILEMLGIVFQDSEFEVVLSNNGMTADQVKDIHPDVILLDINLGNYHTTGTEICKEIKSREDLGRIPILLVSAERDLKSISVDCKADGYITKPFDVKNLISVVKDNL